MIVQVVFLEPSLTNIKILRKEKQNYIFRDKWKTLVWLKSFLFIYSRIYFQEERYKNKVSTGPFSILRLVKPLLPLYYYKIYFTISTPKANIKGSTEITNKRTSSGLWRWTTRILFWLRRYGSTLWMGRTSLNTNWQVLVKLDHPSLSTFKWCGSRSTETDRPGGEVSSSWRWDGPTAQLRLHSVLKNFNCPCALSVLGLGRGGGLC